MSVCLSIVKVLLVSIPRYPVICFKSKSNTSKRIQNFCILLNYHKFVNI